MNFYEQVYSIVKQIPKGKVTTYGQIAKMMGRPHASQRVGFALHANKDPEHIPCHRVVNRFGKVASGYKFGGENIQKQILQNEGIVFDGDTIDLQKYLWHPE